jgi:hypothetical protein
MDLLDEPDIEQLLDFFMDEVLLLNKLLLGLLLHWSGIRVELQMVLNYLPRDPEHLWWLLGKHVDISLEEGDEHEFLFVTQIPHDASGLGGVRADLDDLHRDVLIVWGLHVGCHWWVALGWTRGLLVLFAAADNNLLGYRQRLKLL